MDNRATKWSQRNEIVIPRSCRETFLPLQGSLGAPLRRAGIRLAGTSVLSRGYRIDRVAPDFHLVLCTISGEAKVRFADFDGVLRSGDVLVSPAGHPCAYATRAGIWKIVWFHLEDGAGWTFLRGAEPAVLRDEGDLEPAGPAIEAFAREVLGRHDSAARICSLHSSLILAYLKRLLTRVAGNPAADAKGRLSPVWDRVNADLAQDWNAAGLAELAGLSTTHFARLCRAAYGAAPMREVTRLRMERAREMLADTDLAISAIAERVGYADAFAFSTAFKRSYGTSPSSIRRSVAGIQPATSKLAKT